MADTWATLESHDKIASALAWASFNHQQLGVRKILDARRGRITLLTSWSTTDFGEPPDCYFVGGPEGIGIKVVPVAETAQHYKWLMLTDRSHPGLVEGEIWIKQIGFSNYPLSFVEVWCTCGKMPENY